MKKTLTTGFRLSEQDYGRLKAIAEGKGIMTASLIRMIVVEYLRRAGA